MTLPDMYKTDEFLVNIYFEPNKVVTYFKMLLIWLSYHV